MTFEVDLKQHLQTAASLGALVGSRIWPLVRYNDTKPAITYQIVGTVPQVAVDGGTGDLDNVRVQIDAWADTYDAARQVAAAVRTAMASFSTNSVPLIDQDFYEQEPRIYRVSLDFSCWYRTS